MLSRFCLFVASLLLASLALAETPDPKMQMLFVGTEPAQAVSSDIPSINLSTLPSIEAAQQTVFAARLRASPVSTFVATDSDAHAQFEQFFLVTQVGLATGENGTQIALGSETFGLSDFSDRVSALVGAFKPKHRRIGLVHMNDPDDIFPMAIGDIQTALTSIGFDLIVLMIEGETGTSECRASEPLHYSLVSGLPDRAPFGNGDGISTAAEVEEYLSNALSRQSERNPACGPRYSVLMKSSNDPAQELVAYQGRSAFTEMETKLYNETFEAMFLLESQSPETVQGFLASCLYCPNETALTNHLRDMEDFARTTALEAKIWERIQNDTDAARLAIYLENCDLCTYSDAANAKISEIEAKAQAYDAEALAYSNALNARDLGALRSYVADCIACAFQDQAQNLVAEIEADEAYKVETAAFVAAIDTRDIELLSGYISECSICEGRDEASSVLRLETQRVELALPCLAMASVPQLGGPRQLEEIDPNTAINVCTAAVDAFPEDGVLLTTLGRIAQASGDYATATMSYKGGMDAGVPSAFGLAAYTHYAPAEGVEINLVEAEKLAILGAEKGDWLSQEILTVLYSKGLVPGRTPEEAFEIAQNIAGQGNALGEFFLGYYHLTGTGTASDPAAAETWLAKSVDQGYTHAMAYLAEVYETGPAGEPQPEKAADMYWRALQQGDETAINRLTTQLASRNRDVIILIQQKLAEVSPYNGGADGIAGPGTVTAIRDYAESLQS